MSKKEEGINQNVIMDFNKSPDSTQPLAIMPARLAVKLLKDYADSLVHSNVHDITKRHTDHLLHLAGSGSPLREIVDASLEFVNERTLINNVKEGNWEVYNITDTNLGDILGDSVRVPEGPSKTAIIGVH